MYAVVVYLMSLRLLVLFLARLLTGRLLHRCAATAAATACRGRGLGGRWLWVHSRFLGRLWFLALFSHLCTPCLSMLFEWAASIARSVPGHQHGDTKYDHGLFSLLPIGTLMRQAKCNHCVQPSFTHRRKQNTLYPDLKA
jgi:hypothetical protein